MCRRGGGADSVDGVTGVTGVRGADGVPVESISQRAGTLF